MSVVLESHKILQLLESGQIGGHATNMRSSPLSINGSDLIN
jgi:hypothetical protein